MFYSFLNLFNFLSSLQYPSKHPTVCCYLSSAQVSGTLFHIPFVLTLKPERNRLLFFFFCMTRAAHISIVLDFYKLYHPVNRSNLCPAIFLQSDVTVLLLVACIFYIKTLLPLFSLCSQAVFLHFFCIVYSLFSIQSIRFRIA